MPTRQATRHDWSAVDREGSSVSAYHYIIDSDAGMAYTACGLEKALGESEPPNPQMARCKHCERIVAPIYARASEPGERE